MIRYMYLRNTGDHAGMKREKERHRGITAADDFKGYLADWNFTALSDIGRSDVRNGEMK